MRWRLWIGAGVLELVWVGVARLGDLRAHADRFLWLVVAAFFTYLFLVWTLRRSPAASLREDRRLLVLILGAGILFRLTLAGLTPTLSDDIYRYLWDGRVQLAGINPYRYAPDDPALASLRTPEWELINHKQIPTIYPPLMQLAFRASAWISPTVVMQKLPFVLCDVAIMVLLAWWLPRIGVSSVMSLLYAWHPLVIVEVAGSGHNDALGVFWLLIGLILWHSQKRVMATTAFALSFLSKFTTALLWPWYVVRHRRLGLIFLGLVALGGLSCLCSPHFTPGLRHYAQAWEFNSALYSVLVTAWPNPLVIRLLLGGGVMMLGMLWARRSDDLVGYTLLMIQAAVLVTPVLEPWYLVWMIPLLCLRFSWPWLFFTGASMLSYAVLVNHVRHGVWEIPLWVKMIEYGPLYAWLLWRAWKRTAQTSDIRHQTSVVERS